MSRRGLHSLFPMADLSVMGLVEVLPRLPRLMRRLRETVGAIRQLRPGAVITIDSPGFTLRVARRLKGLGVPIIHYVAPTVWAWRPGRAPKLARLVDHLLVLLPFEPPYFEAVGMRCSFVGHPVVESGAADGDGPRFRAAQGIASEAPLLCLLPGSRAGEVGRLLPVFAATVRRLAEDREDLRIVVPTVEAVESLVREAVASWPCRPVVVAGEDQKYDAFAAANAALAASGTVAVELAMAETPAIVTYRVSGLTAWLVRRMVRVRYVNLVNILLDREVVPERLQEACDPATLAPAVAELLDSGEAARRQIEAVAEALDLLGRGGEPPSQRAARTILDVIEA